MSIGLTSPPVSRPRTPDIRNPAKFVCVDRVPIVDILEREIVRYGRDGQPHRIVERIDERQLRRILENTRLRASQGELGLVFLGHTDDDGPETDQPPVVGYMDDYEIGQHNGVPAILANIYIRKNANPARVVEQFPRRSAEIVGIDRPNGFIDSVALLKRTPERPLGLCSHLSHSQSISRFECPGCSGGDDMPMTSAAGRTVKARKAITKKALALFNELIQDVIDGEENANLDADGDGRVLDDAPGDEFADGGPMDDEEELPPLGDEGGYGPEGGPGQDLDMDGVDDGLEDGVPDNPDDEPVPEHGERPEHLCAACGGTGRARMEDDDRPERFATQEPDEATRFASGVDPTAGMGGPYTTIPGTPMRKPPKPKPTGSPQPQPAASRMRRDSDRIAVSRFQKIVNEQARQIDALTARLNSADQRTDQANVEREVIQLEAEGILLDRPTEVARLSKIPAADRPDEIARMRKYYSKSPVGAPPIPPVWGDSGGTTLPRRPSLAELQAISPEDLALGGIRGLSAARFARDLESDEAFRGATGLDRAQMVVSRMQAAREGRGNN